MKKNILYYALCTVFIYFVALGAPQVSTVSAQTTQTSCTVTAIGNPQGSPSLPPECGAPSVQPSTETSTPNSSSNNLIAAGEAIKEMYYACPPKNGTTYNDYQANNTCYNNYLKSKGYSQGNIDEMETRRDSTFVPPPYLNCTECLGFVAISLTLETGGKRILLDGLTNAAAVANLNSFQAGSIIYKKLPSGTGPSAGDIGVNNKGDGHIVIFLKRNGALFTALESSGAATCTVTDTRSDLEVNNYVFFRAQ